MMQHPEIIAEYCQYDDSNPFQSICLQVAIQNNEESTTQAITEEASKPVAVVCYHTPSKMMRLGNLSY